MEGVAWMSIERVENYQNKKNWVKSIIFMVFCELGKRRRSHT